ncbi:DUF5703 family protein [Georgenia satyanarayanai]|uniref:Uncharacterized protein n=1 Tax=Oceanitalea stevensii TaxID=2763072 RepID=A0ABR8Z1Y4_9MICO|nr:MULTISPECIES: DUF5703 family protein [Georgenia]MBD8062315.1 hypothetical protein [Oceanitalea stevensii]MCM3662091.1 DUF5703 family protein [Georgenia satyanarayanai]
MVWYTPETSPRPDVRSASQYEFRVLSLPPTASRSQVRQLLTEEAEYGRWELARTRLYIGGSRKVWLRRKIIKVRSTL